MGIAPVKYECTEGQRGWGSLSKNNQFVFVYSVMRHSSLLEFSDLSGRIASQ